MLSRVAHSSRSPVATRAVPYSGTRAYAHVTRRGVQAKIRRGAAPSVKLATWSPRRYAPMGTTPARSTMPAGEPYVREHSPG